MLSANRITPKKIKRLGVGWTISFLLFSCFLFHGNFAFSQNNSPYSRYGLGDLSTSNNITNRSMGGITAAYANPLTVNFNNPASYSSFLVYLEERSKKPVSGRVLLDVGINFENRTLKENNNPEKFRSGNAIFSYLQVGVPIRRNWGLSFGLRPLTRVDYKIGRVERLIDPGTGLPIDSAYTEFAGNGVHSFQALEQVLHSEILA
jgi:hypothetical protein